MGGNDKTSESDGAWPGELFKHMKEGHEQFMRDLMSEKAAASTSTSASDVQQPAGSRNPFVVFKSMVDKSLDSLWNLPSNLAEIRSKMLEDRQRRRAEDLDACRRWTGTDATFDHIDMLVRRADPELRRQAADDVMQLLRESARRNAHVPAHKIKRLFDEPNSSASAGQELFGMTPSKNRDWLGVDWFKHNMYSPIRLEADRATASAGPTWRLAFEDLLQAALDKPMDDEEDYVGVRPHSVPQSTLHGPGLDWMLSLQCRGVLPVQSRAFWDEYDTRSRHGLQEQLENHFATTGQVLHKYGRFLDSGMNALVREVATPAPAQSYVGMPMSTSTVPETEDDLYGLYRSLYGHELPNGRQQNSSAQCPAANSCQGDAQYVDERSRAVIARDLKDVEEAANCLPEAVRQEQERAMLEYSEVMAQALRDALLSKVSAEHSDDLADMWEEHRAASAKQPNEEEIALEQQAEALGIELSQTEQAAFTTAESKPETEAKAKTVDVLSSLTTTQTTRLPDGTVTTKVVLKQRFADGGEETHEKVHTYQESPHQRQAKRVKEEEQGENAPREKGWFWT